MKSLFKKKKSSDTLSGDATKNATPNASHGSTNASEDSTFTTISLPHNQNEKHKSQLSSLERGRSILQNLGHSSSSSSNTSSTDKQRVQQAFNDVDILFQALMDVLDIHPADQERYLQLNDTEKWHLILTHNDRLGSRSTSSYISSLDLICNRLRTDKLELKSQVQWNDMPELTTNIGSAILKRSTDEMLVTEHDLRQLTSLRVDLGALPLKWQNEFIEYGGLGSLVEVLGELQECQSIIRSFPVSFLDINSNELSFMTECIRCIKLTANKQDNSLDGLNALLAENDSLVIIASCIPLLPANTCLSNQLQTMISLCLDLLMSINKFSDGLQRIDEALSRTALNRRLSQPNDELILMPQRFYELISLLDPRIFVKTKLREKALILLNIISSDRDRTPDERSLIREELDLMGLSSFLRKLYKSLTVDQIVQDDSDEFHLIKQIQMYFDVDEEGGEIVYDTKSSSLLTSASSGNTWIKLDTDTIRHDEKASLPESDHNSQATIQFHDENDQIVGMVPVSPKRKGSLLPQYAEYIKFEPIITTSTTSALLPPVYQQLDSHHSVSRCGVDKTFLSDEEDDDFDEEGSEEEEKAVQKVIKTVSRPSVRLSERRSLHPETESMMTLMREELQEKQKTIEKLMAENQRLSQTAQRIKTEAKKSIKETSIVIEHAEQRLTSERKLYQQQIVDLSETISKLAAQSEFDDQVDDESRDVAKTLVQALEDALHHQETQQQQLISQQQQIELLQSQQLSVRTELESDLELFQLESKTLRADNQALQTQLTESSASFQEQIHSLTEKLEESQSLCLSLQTFVPQKVETVVQIDQATAQQIATLRQQLESTDLQLTDHQQQLVEHQETISNLENRLEESFYLSRGLKEQAEGLSVQLKSRERELEILLVEKKLLGDELRGWKELHASISKERDQLLQQSKDVIRSLSSPSVQFNFSSPPTPPLKSEDELLKGIVDSLQVQLKTEKKEKRKLETQLAEISSSLAQVDVLTQERNRLCTENQELTLQIIQERRDFDQTLQQSQFENQRLVLEVQHLQADLEEDRKERDQLKESQTILQSEMQIAQQMIAERDDGKQRESLQTLQQIEENKQTIVRLSTELDEIRSTLQTAQKTNEDLEAQLESADRKIQSILLKSQTELEHEKETRETIEQQRDAALANNQRLTEQITTLCDQMNDLRTSCDQLRTDLQISQETLLQTTSAIEQRSSESLSQAHEQLEIAHRELTEKAIAHQKHIVSLEREIDSLKAASQSAQQQISSLEQQLLDQQLESEHQIKSIAQQARSLQQQSAEQLEASFLAEIERMRTERQQISSSHQEEILIAKKKAQEELDAQRQILIDQQKVLLEEQHQQQQVMLETQQKTLQQQFQTLLEKQQQQMAQQQQRLLEQQQQTIAQQQAESQKKEIDLQRQQILDQQKAILEQSLDQQKQQLTEQHRLQVETLQSLMAKEVEEEKAVWMQEQKKILDQERQRLDQSIVEMAVSRDEISQQQQSLHQQQHLLLEQREQLRVEVLDLHRQKLDQEGRVESAKQWIEAQRADWEAQKKNEKEVIDQQKVLLEDQQKAAKGIVDELRRRMEELGVRESEIVERQSALDQTSARLDAQKASLESAEKDLAQRKADLDARKEEVEEKARQLAKVPSQEPHFKIKEALSLVPSNGNVASLPNNIAASAVPKPSSSGPAIVASVSSSASVSSAAGPPPPPPIAMGGPGGPPPPPPPMMGKGGMPPPPMMPGGMSVPLEPEVVPSVKMKPILWNKIPNFKVQGTIWATPVKDLETIEVPRGELEELFVAKTVNASSSVSSGAGSGAAEDKPVTLLDSRKAQNLAIILSSTRCTAAQLKKAILAVDESVLNAVIIRQLSANCISGQEQETIDEYVASHPNAKLGVAESFFHELSSVTLLKERLEAMGLKQSLSNKLPDLNADVETVSKATKELRGSAKFAAVLRIVLQLGNFMNGGTFRGRALGFSLSSLLTLTDTKSSDGAISLLHYLVQFISKNFAGLVQFGDDLEAVGQSGKVAWQSVKEDIFSLRKKLTEVQSVVETIEPVSNEDRFKMVFKQFLVEANEQLSATERAFQQTNQAFVELASFFGEEKPEVVSPSELFGLVNDFVAAFQRAKKDLIVEKMRQEREAKRAVDKEKRLSVLAANKQRKSTAPAGGETEEGAVDGIVSEMREGAYRNSLARKSNVSHLAVEAVARRQSRVQRPSNMSRNPNLPASPISGAAPTSATPNKNINESDIMNMFHSIQQRRASKAPANFAL